MLYLKKAKPSCSRCEETRAAYYKQWGGRNTGEVNISWFCAMCDKPQGIHIVDGSIVSEKGRK